MTGYRGRVAVYELLEIDREQADAIRRNDMIQFARIAAARTDFKPLSRAAIELALRGLTTLAEVMSSVSGVGDVSEPPPAAQAPGESDELGAEHVLALLG
jgi:MSHA biogenesis protein MshE